MMIAPSVSMKFLALVGLATFLIAFPAAGARGTGGTKTVEIYVAVPGGAVTTVTSEQAVQTIQRILGQPTDSPCLIQWNPYDSSTWTCSVEGWFRHELGRVFTYRLLIVPISIDYPLVDACGSYAGAALYFYVDSQLVDVAGASFTTHDRAMILTLGAGGWAGHFSPVPDHKVDYHFGMVGDWGVMENFDLRNACVPSWDSPARGLSHELAGMMGMYVTDGYDGALFVGDSMTANNKKDLLHYSGSWLRSP